tara:strand:+ start:262 stop:456 length:195 start_codon:yes stop_codon:yes gene_type:complete
MKKFIKSLFGTKAKQEKSTPKNIIVGVKTLHNIKRWESQKSDLILRSSFNRELYYRIVDLKKAK